MIVKISSGRSGGWIFYDKLDEILVYPTSMKDEVSEIIEHSCPTEWRTIEEHADTDLKFLKVLKLISNGEIKKRIIIDINKVYLMSDEGKTVERLN